MPDYIGALIVRLRAAAAITAICPSANITAQRSRVPAKTYGVVLKKSGGAGSDEWVPMMSVRVDVMCYGPNELSAMNLWRAVQSELQPVSRRGGAFTAAGCHVCDIGNEAAPVELVDPDDQTPLVFVPYRMLVHEMAVA